MRGRLIGIVAGLALCLGLLPAVAAAECDPVLPSDGLAAGMTGTGWTVASGRTRESFDVEVLGVLENGIAPGRDMIIVQTSSPRIDATGIWAGMSGSPVYVGAQFIGAVAFGLTYGPSTIAGLTPAEDMLDLVSMPATAAIRRLDLLPRSVRLPAGLARTVADRAGISTVEAAGLTQLRLPLSVSGIGAAGIQRMTDEFRQEGRLFIPYAGGSVSRAAAGPVPSVEPGDNLVATVSYGDLSIAAVGTASYVCDGVAVGFGHPATFGGDVTLGMNAADAITIAPETLGAPYKLANVAETIGTLDQDRLAGIRGILGAGPAATPIRTKTKAPELGRVRDGATDVIPPDWAGTATFYHLLGGYDSTLDSSGRGSSSVWYTFAGHRSDGSTWELTRGNRYYSPYEISPETAYGVAIQLESLMAVGGDGVTLDRVDVSTTIERAVRAYKIGAVSVSRNGGPFTTARSIGVRPGMRLRIRVVLKPVAGGASTTVVLPLRLPPGRFPEGYITLSAGDGFFFFDEEEEGEDPTFDELLAELKGMRRNDVLGADLVLFDDEDGDESVVKSSATRLPSVVIGDRTIRLVPRGG